MTIFLKPESNLSHVTLKSFTQFFEFISTKFDSISPESQLQFIISIISCIAYLSKKDKDTEELLPKLVEAYKTVFKESIRKQSIANLKLFASTFDKVNISESNLICRTFCKFVDHFDKFSELTVIYLNLTVSLAKRNFNSLKPVESNNFVSFLCVYLRHFIKILRIWDMEKEKEKDKRDDDGNHDKSPQNTPPQIIMSGFKMVFESFSLVNKNILNIETFPKLFALLENLFSFLSSNHEILNEFDRNNLFDGIIEMIYFKEVSQLNSDVQKTVFKTIMKKKEKDRKIGILLASKAVEKESLFELYMKCEFGDIIENLTDTKADTSNTLEYTSGSKSTSSSHATTLNSDLVQMELFSKLLVSNNCRIEKLLSSCSKSYFISDLRIHSKFTNLLKLSLLSQTSEGLTETLKRNLKGTLNTSSLFLLSNFPFSLWRSLEKQTVKIKAK